MTLPMILVCLALWTLTLTLPGTIALLLAADLKTGFGNRDNVPELPAWGARGVRAHRNMVENLPVFLALLLAAQLAEASPEKVASGATVFLWARVAHGIIYIAGIPYLRTAAFVVSIGALFTIAGAVMAAAG